MSATGIGVWTVSVVVSRAVAITVRVVAVVIRTVAVAESTVGTVSIAIAGGVIIAVIVASAPVYVIIMSVVTRISLYNPVAWSARWLSDVASGIEMGIPVVVASSVAYVYLWTGLVEYGTVSVAGVNIHYPCVVTP